jgi:hypothetical protein
VNASLELQQGDCMLLYTDGIPETQDPGGDFLDLERVKGWLASTGSRHPARFADNALGELRRWRGGSALRRCDPRRRALYGAARRSAGDLLKGRDKKAEGEGVSERHAGCYCRRRNPSLAASF